MRLLLIIFSMFPVLLSCQSDMIHVIPRPVSVESADGFFTLTAKTQVFYPDDESDWAIAAQAWTAVVKSGTGFDLKTKTYHATLRQTDNQAIYFLPDASISGAEAYRLEVHKRSIVIRAQTAAGAFYAVQTLRQLFPPEINSLSPSGKTDWKAPCCTIADAPRFAYRGLHLDVGRHFFPVDYIKRYIDLMAFHKVNTFHWHLTDDQGWRIEIKKYPKLNSIAACRDSTIIGHNADQPRRYDGKPYCGIYTQEEIREVIAYAQQRFITIVPEIEMPGHALAALSAYPELGCTGGPYKAAGSFGVFDDVFCAGNEETFRFVEEVLTEVSALFPGPYVHVGGDECPKTRWKTCPKCQARMKAEGLKDEHELQSYFIRRAEKILAAQGKKLIGWDEILEGGLAPSATVMSWRGTEGGIAAAREHHDVIMTPTSNCYFDYYQSKNVDTEPLAIGGYLPIEQVYAYEPVPDVLSPEEARFILGAQANVWTEYIATPDYLEYMLYPRMCAMSEVQWTAKEKRDWSDFAGRLSDHLARLDALQVHYAKSIYDVEGVFSQGTLTLRCNDPLLTIRYTTDGTAPSGQSTAYFAPIVLNRSVVVNAAAFRQEQQVGNIYTAQCFVHKALGRPYTLSGRPEKYNGGDPLALTNGTLGSLRTWRNWVGLVNKDLDPVIDLGDVQSFEQVTTHFLNNKPSHIYPPLRVEVLVSDDGLQFRSVARQEIRGDALPGRSLEMVVLPTPGVKARYVKLVATTQGMIPAGQAGEGNGAWLFLDEIIIE